MPVTEPPLQRLRMSWEEYLALPERPRAEWVDGEVVVTPQVGFAHGHASARLMQVLMTHLPGLYVVTEVGLWLPGNRLRGPDVMVVAEPPTETWVRDAPVLVAEVLSPSTRVEDTVRKSVDYLAGGAGQYWIVDPDHREMLVHAAVDGSWELLLALDDDRPSGEIPVAGHGVVELDLADLFLPDPPRRMP
ncbi:Uma2 family endonuclease [Nocardioides sp. AE5]|uniref:Uma2 family endonuclease n=1 Tax=Nocardioides sp. AE5 TaxID=2962573 RepID=UPI0028824748|nr:Uma2 family endonuclease [Nocardioides sp. AE5]MDT0203078.1 Uma2 family endonuclease [Nocardioides sp. AE5]